MTRDVSGDASAARIDDSSRMRCATTDMGPGTYTSATQVAGDTLGLPVDRIKQGSVFPGLRARSVQALIPLGFEGYAIGGLAVGEGQAAMFAVLDATAPQLPADKPRYLMGVGTPDDLLGAVARGVDMFDCVMPTRAGRTARAYTSVGVLNLRNARHAADAAPLDPACRCLA